VEPKSALMSEHFKTGQIQGVVIRDLGKFTDTRGWLTELFRQDDLEAEFFPVMAYISSTNPGMTRGPHEHLEQADLFCFVGPSNFKLRMWDNRVGSETFNNIDTLIVGEDNPKLVLIPAGVVHAYQNVGTIAGLVFNFPNRLYKGAGKREKVDEIRHEDGPDMIYGMED
jgi:dTDP-4-dehydrorhamnose 3,5-epimerase